MDDERLHQDGPKVLKTMLTWAEQLDDSMVRPAIKESGENVLFNDLADRIRERGLNVAVDYGFDHGRQTAVGGWSEGQAVRLGGAHR